MWLSEKYIFPEQQKCNDRQNTEKEKEKKSFSPGRLSLQIISTITEGVMYSYISNIWNLYFFCSFKSI